MGLRYSGKQDRAVLERNGMDETGERRPSVFGVAGILED